MAAGKKVARSEEQSVSRKASKLVVRIFEGKGKTPAKTVTIPLAVFQFARKLIPASVLEELQQEGIDLERILEMPQDMDTPATLIEVDDHRNSRKVTVTFE